ncbi:MAG: YdeI/OmpD-associated family protein, partial [Longimicrobiales bacterium]
MSDPRPEFFATPAELRSWFEANHDRRDVLMLGYHRKATGRPSVTWPESVDVALCFGWIDGVRRSLDEERYVIRFTPRRKGSHWSARNIERMTALIEAGQATEAGLAAWRKRTAKRSRRSSFEQGDVALTDAFQARFEAHGGAWDWFAAQSPYYRRTATWWV